MLAVSYLPHALVEGSAITRVDTGEGGTYARLAELGHAPTHFREEIRSRLPTAEEAEGLQSRSAGRSSSCAAPLSMLTTGLSRSTR